MGPKPRSYICSYILIQFFMSSRFAKETRGRTRTAITKLYNDRANFNAYDIIKLNNARLKLEKAEVELACLDEKIFSLDLDKEGVADEAISEELNACHNYKEKIFESLSLLSTLATNHNAGRSQGSYSEQSTSPAHNVQGPGFRAPLSQLKSPVAPLPRFTSSEGENLLLFFNQFEETLSKFVYTQYDKLLLLKQQITGKASLLIESLEPDKQTYDDAKALLKAALASTEIQKFNVIKQLSELKMSYTSEPFQFISDVRKMMQSIKSLDITVEDILSYFVFYGLNDSFRTQLTLITNNTRPDINAIVENFFKANERYELARKNYKSTKFPPKVEQETTVMTADCKIAKNPFHSCTLCTDATHAINKCSNYLKPLEKIGRLKRLNACIKCANLDHTSEACNFRFNKTCNLCRKWHFTFLCPERIEDSGPKNANLCKVGPPAVRKDGRNPKQRNDRSTNSNVSQTANATEAETSCMQIICASYFQDNFDDVDSALSTFTVSQKEGKYVRGLYDTGSQSSFISEKLLKKFPHEILNDEINLTIKGINNVKTVKSKLVKVKLNFGAVSFTVNLLTVPCIKISLKLPNLDKVVSQFLGKNYALADELLSSSSSALENIDIILGANAAFCFEGNTVAFGKSSVYLDTKFGVLLLGSINDMVRDFSNLDKHIKVTHTAAYNVQSSCFAINLGFATENNVHLAQNDTGRGQEYSAISKSPDSISFDKCSDEVLEDTCSYHLNKETEVTENNTELHINQIRYLLDNSTRADDGRLIFPLLWNSDVKHFLAKNFNLAKSVLASTLKKLKQDPSKLEMADNNIKDLESLGIIEKVHNLDSFMEENPTCSFLAHNFIFKPQKETTKCRMVFMSNLAEKCQNPNQLSHNQCMYSGPSINQKLSTALLLLRFDSQLVVFDIRKAFCMVGLTASDANKLLFLWVRNVHKGDFSVQAYRNTKLSFGLKCSPCILLAALYKMLVIDGEKDIEKMRRLKGLIYSLTYMDNCAFTCNSSDELNWAYESLQDIFAPYKFELQQHYTNNLELQTKLGEQSQERVELLGLNWDTNKDSLVPKQKILDPKADTKRKILQSIAQNFDPFNYGGPLLNRARLFMHDLQCMKELKWDTKLSNDQMREWRNIAHQLNSASEICIPRCVGDRNASYRLIAFTDASQTIYGCVLYLQNLDTKEVHFILSKNRIVGKMHESKSIPSLEFAAITLGVETLVDTKNELSGSQCMFPINIVDMKLYTDSLCCLNWLDSSVNKLDKMNKVSVFVNNRLEKVSKLCEAFPIEFSFVQGFLNPADATTRPMSYKLLMKSCYMSGPAFLTTPDPDISRPDILSITVPNPKFALHRSQEETLVRAKHGHKPHTETRVAALVATGQAALRAPSGEGACGLRDKHATSEVSHLIPLDRFSKLGALIKTHEYVFKFINNLKSRLVMKYPVKYSHFNIVVNTHEAALNFVLKCEQMQEFPDLYEYFHSSENRLKSMPNLVQQLNCFIDVEGFVRVGSKMLKAGREVIKYCPILLPKNSMLTKLIIDDYHRSLAHGGVYNVLTELRKKYWLPCSFSVVKKVLKICVHCKRFNARTIKLNQSGYRDFRLTPNNVPFSYIALDYAGPYKVRDDHSVKKVYILVITCLFTRAINLKVSSDMSTGEFLRSFQIHCHEQGVPSFVLSDMGSNIVAGADIISNFLNEPQTSAFFNQSGSKIIEFHQYDKGHHELGSLVETCVKAIKRLILGAIRNNVLAFREFEFIVSQTIHLVNRRPVAYRESLRDTTSTVLPQPITPELLLHGYDLTSINLIPSLQTVDLNEANIDETFSPTDNIRDAYRKLRSVRSCLFKLYNEQFIPDLMRQATDNKMRYKPKNHKLLEVGDIVLIKEENTKQTNMPMGIIEKVSINDLGEVTGALVRKGSTGERVKRHSSVLIPLLQGIKDDVETADSLVESTVEPRVLAQPRNVNRRAAAVASEHRTRAMLDM